MRNVCSLIVFAFKYNFSQEIKYNFIKANLKLIKLLLIEKRIDMNNNYITLYQLCLQQCRQSLTFALRPSYQQWCELFFRGKFFR